MYRAAIAAKKVVTEFRKKEGINILYEKNNSDWTSLKGGVDLLYEKNWVDWTMEGEGGLRGVQPMSELFYFFLFWEHP